MQAWTWLELLREQRSVQRESGITKCNVRPCTSAFHLDSLVSFFFRVSTLRLTFNSWGTVSPSLRLLHSIKPSKKMENVKVLGESTWDWIEPNTLIEERFNEDQRRLAISFFLLARVLRFSNKVLVLYRWSMRVNSFLLGRHVTIF